MDVHAHTPVRILIVDDHPVVRAGLSSMLGTHADLMIIGTASSGREAIAILQENTADVLLLDLRMPEISGIDVLNHLRSQPGAPRSIILSNYEMDEDIFRAVQAGAQGYLLKDTAQQSMIEAIKTVAAGRRYFPPHIASRLADRMMRATLTARELEIVEMLAKGVTNKELGRMLQISEHTARNHVNSIIEKLEVSDRTEAASAAILRGIIHP